MEILGELLAFLRLWGLFFGLIFCAVGACCFFVGVRMQISEARKLDELISSQPNKMADGKRLDKAISVRDNRSRERDHAKRLEIVGIALFVLGLILQAFSSFPVK
jgi:hypothetical protein